MTDVELTKAVLDAAIQTNNVAQELHSLHATLAWAAAAAISLVFGILVAAGRITAAIKEQSQQQWHEARLFRTDFVESVNKFLQLWWPPRRKDVP